MSSVPLTPEQLASFSPMDFLSPHYRQQLHASLTYLQRPAGTPLLQKGAHSLAQYYLLEGKVAVDSGPARQTIEGGSPQAHMPLNPGQNNPNSVRAITDVSLFAVEHQLLERLLAWSQDAAYQVSSLGDGMVEETAEEDDWLARLLGTPLFGRLPPSHLHALLARFEHLPVRAGECVVTYGEPGEHFYVIKSGRARVSLPAAYREQPAQVLESGDFFGEEALVSGAVRSASVIMLEDGELARLHREAFVELVRPTLIPHIGGGELERLARGGRQYLLLDVRLALEYRAGHLPDSLNLPVANLRTHADALDRATCYVVTPEGGIRSELAVHLLNQLGFDAYLLDEAPPAAA